MSKLDEKFLEKNNFTETKVGAGCFPWVYEDKNILVSINLFSDGGDFPSIYVENKETCKSITFSNTHHAPYFLSIEDFRKCINFIETKDIFNYE